MRTTIATTATGTFRNGERLTVQTSIPNGSSRRSLFVGSVILMAVSLAPAQTMTVEPIANPAGKGSLQPNWSASASGVLLVSWTEKLADGTYALRFATRHGSTWSEPQTVATHRHFFRHPAELPEVITLSDKTMLAHWVETPEAGSDAEFVYVSASRDGLHWSIPAMANKDHSQVEHGLASMVESGNGEASLTWLQALKGEDGPVSLMRSVIGEDGKASKEEALDADVCACCPTSIVRTSRGLLVAYRDHTPADIRDISTIRFEGGRWLPSKTLNADNWKLNACPVNAAAAAAKGDHVAISWFTGAGSTPHVQVVFSTDGGTTFTKPVLVSTGHALGYTSIALDDQNGAYVSWLEQGANSTRVLVRHITAAESTGPVLEVDHGARQAIGYPRLIHTGGETWIAWGSPTASKIQTARLK